MEIAAEIAVETLRRRHRVRQNGRVVGALLGRGHTNTRPEIRTEASPDFSTVVDYCFPIVSIA